MKTCLIVVDFQVDFLPGGALAVEGGYHCLPSLLEAAKEANLIVFSRDWHPADHESFSTDPLYEDGSWPSHCVIGTEGAQLDQTFFCDVLDLGKDVEIIDKGCFSNIEAYSAFDGKDENGMDLDSVIAAYDIDDVVIGGLALDYCVRATALDSVANSGVRKGYDTRVLIDGTRPVAYASGVKAVQDLVRAGVEFV